MTDSTDRVLASIDEAIDGYVSEDWAVSGDAMRWQPEEPADAAKGGLPDIVHTVEVSFGVDHARAIPPSVWADTLRQALNLHRAIESGEVTPRWSYPDTSDDSDSRWTELGHTADGGFVYARPVPRFNFGGLVPDPETATRIAHELVRAMTGSVEQMRPAVAEMGLAFGTVGKSFKSLAERSHVQIAPRLYGDDYRRHRRPCRLCNPAGNPKPLTVNGAEYRRRTRARRRRNRR